MSNAWIVALVLVAIGCSGKVTAVETDAAFAHADVALDTTPLPPPPPIDAGTETTPVTPELCGKCVESKCKATWDACLASKACTDRALSLITSPIIPNAGPTTSSSG